MYEGFLNSDTFCNMMLNGVKVWEEPYKFLHMKAYQIDDNILNLGSMNQDITSFYCNNEANILVKTQEKHEYNSVQ